MEAAREEVRECLEAENLCLAAVDDDGRVLKPGGEIAVSEILVDPDYPRASTVARWAAQAGLRPVRKIGNLWYYTLFLARPRE